MFLRQFKVIFESSKVLKTNTLPWRNQMTFDLYVQELFFYNVIDTTQHAYYFCNEKEVWQQN